MTDILNACATPRGEPPVMDIVEQLHAHGRGAINQCTCRSDKPTCGSCLAGVAAAEITRLRAALEWRTMDSAPRDKRMLGKVDGKVRIICWGKTSHVPMYGWCLIDQGAEERDLCEPDGWMPLPAIADTAPAA